MTTTVETLKSQAVSLSRDERAELAYFLLTSLEPLEEDDEDAWRKELDRRFAEMQDGTAIGRPVDVVLAELRARFS